jgi:hypothetical protein
MHAVTKAALKILRPHVGAMRSYAALNPMPEPPEKRIWPTQRFVWRRYVTSMITSMTRSSVELWDGLHDDPEWMRLTRGEPSACPSQARVRRLLVRHNIRFPAQKAARIRRAIDRDFDGFAEEMRATFAGVHDRRRARDVRRREEVRLAVLLQDLLARCGVAPKIARLAIMGAPEITQLIPIDSRWMNALREAGADVTPTQLATESRYFQIEEAICEAAYRLKVHPSVADGIPFGWLVGEGV